MRLKLTCAIMRIVESNEGSYGKDEDQSALRKHREGFEPRWAVEIVVDGAVPQMRVPVRRSCPKTNCLCGFYDSAMSSDALEVRCRGSTGVEVAGSRLRG